jgi:cytoskeletal protein CcmA (bactofilin family)
MFSKPSKTPSRPAPPRATPTSSQTSSAPPPLEPPAQRKPPSVVSVIGKDITIEGGVNGEGELHVDGLVRGDVRVGRLSIGDSGLIEGTVNAELVEVRGKIVGSVTAKQIRLFATANVDGDITHEQLAMETGACFQGRSLKFQRPAPAREPAPAPMGDVISLGAAAVKAG